MRILSRAIRLGACGPAILMMGGLLVAAPLAVGPAGAAPLQAPPAEPYHQPSMAGHALLLRAGDRDDDERRRWRHRRPHHWGMPHDMPRWGAPRFRGWPHGQGWAMPQFGHQRPHFAPRPLPRWVVEDRLRQQSFRPFGRITLREGMYLVPALDRHGRRVLLVADPATGTILGRQRHR